MKYTDWQLINEAIGSGGPLGLSHPHIVGGPLGGLTLRESPIEDEDEEEDEDDEDADDDEEDLEGDIMGSTEDDGIGPLKSFPPDDAEDMDGLPTPDEEMIDGDEAPAVPGGGGDVPPELGADDEMGDTLAGIDPDLAGLGGDQFGTGGEVPPEIADAGPGMDMPDDMGVADMPCPDCNPEGEGLPGEGQPECPTCGGEGFVGDEEGEMPALGGEEDLAAIGSEEEGDFGDEEADLDDEEGDFGDEEMPPEEVDAEIQDQPTGKKDAEMAELMAKMQDYCRKYMNAPNTPQPNAPGSDVLQFPQGAPEPPTEPRVPLMAKKQVKFMSKGGKEISFMAKDAKKCVKCMDKCESTDDAFLSSLKNGAQRPQKQHRVAEDALLQRPVAPETDEPQPGQVGFAPQGKVGAIGGGYTMDDFKDIPVLGESHRYPTFADWASKKSK